MNNGAGTTLEPTQSVGHSQDRRHVWQNRSQIGQASSTDGIGGFSEAVTASSPLHIQQSIVARFASVVSRAVVVFRP